MFGTNSQNRGGMLRPFQELEQITSSLLGRTPKLDFTLDVKDQGEAYVLEADLPGLKKEDLSVTLEGNYLTISAQRSDQQQEEDASGSYIRRERNYGSLSRTFDISEVDTEGITASYRAGVLSLWLPKKHWEGQNIRQVEIH